MMKLGCMSLSYQKAMAEGHMDLLGFIDTAYELRLDGIDIHVRHLASTDEEYLRDVRMRCLKRGLAISYLAVSNNFGLPEPEVREQVEMVKQWTDVAARMGVPLLRIFAAWVPEGEDEEAIWRQMIPCIKEVAAHGGERGVVIGLHNHNHRCVTRTGEDVVRILEEVDHPYFSHILDTGQYIGSPGASGAQGKEDPALNFYGSIECTAPYAIHVRAKIYRVATGEEVWLDYPRIFEILRGARYNGCVSIVYEGQAVEPEETAVPKAVTYLRRLMQDG